MNKPNGQERFNKPVERNAFGLGLVEHDSLEPKMEGHLFAVLKFQDGREEIRDMGKNIITSAASVLLARLMQDNTTPAYGAFGLAVGTGNIAWNPSNPPPATAAQTQLENELFRKQFQSINFTNNGVVSPTPTNVIDCTTFFVESEANGALDEMGI